MEFRRIYRTQKSASPRECGDCRLCCKVMAIKDIDKPCNSWCQFVNLKGPGGGCKIYDRRPDECRDYLCGWLQGAMPIEWKPNKCHFTVSATLGGKDLVVYVDPGYPDAHKKPDVIRTLLDIRKDGRAVLASLGPDNFLFLDMTGIWLPCEMKPDPNDPYKVTVIITKEEKELAIIRARGYV